MIAPLFWKNLVNPNFLEKSGAENFNFWVDTSIQGSRANISVFRAPTSSARSSRPELFKKRDDFASLKEQVNRRFFKKAAPKTLILHRCLLLKLLL